MADTCPAGTGARRVVIVGGGYAGTTCAVRLAREMRTSDDIDILLIEPDPCQQALSELDLVAVGPNRPEFCELWHPTIFRGLPVTVCYTRVTSLSPEQRTVRVENGEDVGYWRLVLATGAVPWMPDIPGLAESAVTMWSVADALELQRRTQDAFKAAARVADRSSRRILSFTVVGGGATGVEIVGTLAALLPKRARADGLDAGDLCVSLVEGRDEILFDLPERERGVAVRRLERMGVHVFTGGMLDRVADGVAHLADGRTVDSGVIVWAGGVRADPHAGEWGFETGPAGRIEVAGDLKVDSLPDVYAIGDVAAAKHPETERLLLMLAQMAIQEGPHTADNILREARGEATTPFSPHMRGEFVSIGPRWGVGWMYGLTLSGLPAITMKRITYVKYWLQVGGVSLAWKRTRELFALER